MGLKIEPRNATAFDNFDLMSLIEGVLEGADEEKSGQEMFDEILAFFEEVFDELIEGRLDLVVFMARKAWCLYNAFEPFLYRDGFSGLSWNHTLDEFEEKKRFITNDTMLAPTLNDPKIMTVARENVKIAVVDDTCVKGGAIRKCVRRLIDRFGVDSKNIQVYFYVCHEDAINRGDIEFDITSEVPLIRLKNDTEVGWGRKETPDKLGILRPINNIKSYSGKFVEIFHISSTPYVALSCGFLFDLAWAGGVMGSLDGDPSRYLTQDDLIGDYKNPEIFSFHNITCSAMYKNNIEAFVLFPNELSGRKTYMPSFLAGGNTVKAIRFYVNRPLGKLLLVPYVYVEPVKANRGIANQFPVCKELFDEYAGALDKSVYEGEMAAYRILCCGASYLLGRRFIDKLIEKTEHTDEIMCSVIPMSGLRSSDYHEWLTGNMAEKGYSRLLDIVNDNKLEKLGFEDMCDEGEFEMVFDETFRDFKKETDYFYNTSFTLFDRLNGKIKLGIPIKAFWNALKAKFKELSREKFTATMLFLHDAGAVPMFIAQCGDGIGHCSSPGELSFGDIYEAEPSYAFFLQWFVNVSDNSFNSSKYADMHEVIKKHFEGKREDGTLFLSLNLLLEPLEKIWNWKNEKDEKKKALAKDNVVFCAMPRPEISDADTEFFYNLIDKYRFKI